MSTQENVADSQGLAYLAPDDIVPNPENPRLLFRQGPMDELKKSIYETGIIVPLIVYRDLGKALYVLLDGERRWRCAKELNLPVVPANVIAQPTQVENIVRMFNIHNVRADWEAMPTARKLQQLIELTGKTRSAELAEVTGIPGAQIERLRVLLSFPPRHQEMVLNRDLKHDFLIETYAAWRAITNNLPDVARDHSLESLTDALLEKQKRGVVQSVTEFRDLAKLAGAVARGAPKQAVADRVVRLLEDPLYPIHDAYDSVRALYDFAELTKRCARLADDLDTIHSKDMRSCPAELLDDLRHLGNVISQLLGEAGQ